MISHQLILCFVVLLAQVTLLITYFGFLRQSYFVDEFRQQLFILRDGLFDSARAGKIAFEDAAYQKVRSRINGLIRYSDDLSFMRIIIGTLLFRISPHRAAFQSILKESEESFNLELSALTDEKKQLIKHVQTKTLTLTLVHVLKSSLLIGPLISVLIVSARLLGAAQKISKKLDSFVDRSQFARNISSEAQILGTHSKRYGFRVAT